MMPSIEDFLMLLVIPLLEYIVYPHLQSSMRITIRPIHKVHVHMYNMRGGREGERRGGGGEKEALDQ